MDITSLQPDIHTAVAALLPILVALVAGSIRQDGLPDTANEVISYAVVVVVGATQAFLDGKLGGSPLADFMLVSAYSQAALHSPLLQQLQKYLQGNVLSFIKVPGPTSPTPPAPATPAPAQDANALAQMAFDLMKANAPAVASLVANELAKRFQAPPAQPAPAPVPQPPSPPANTQMLPSLQPASQTPTPPQSPIAGWL